MTQIAIIILGQLVSLGCAWFFSVLLGSALDDKGDNAASVKVILFFAGLFCAMTFGGLCWLMGWQMGAAGS